MPVYHPMLVGRLPMRTTTTTTTTIAPFEPIFDSMDPEKVKKFTTVVNNCLKYAEIIHSKLVPGQIFNVNGSWCAQMHDGVGCWNRAPAGTVVTQLCPKLVVGFKTQVSLYKQFADEVFSLHSMDTHWLIFLQVFIVFICSSNGTWLGEPGTNRTWTDYTPCMDSKDLNFPTNVNLIYVTGYSISVAALLLSLAIFVFFKTLRCTRVRIHMNFFTSITLNNILRILWYKLVVDQVTVVQNNKTWCQILHLLVNFFMVTTYFWVFVEALHLHFSLQWVFVREKEAMRWFKVIGWWLSVIVVMAYAIVRYIYGNVERCWMENSETFWIITAPVLFSLLSSLGILVNVIRKVTTKLSSGHLPNRIVAAKKGVCATISLIPLFGLQFLLKPLRPKSGSFFETTYEVGFALLISLQGFCLSILYCFKNLEIRTAVKALWARICNRNERRGTEDIPMTGATGQVYVENVVRGYRQSSSFEMAREYYGE